MHIGTQWHNSNRTRTPFVKLTLLYSCHYKYCFAHADDNVLIILFYLDVYVYI